MTDPNPDDMRSEYDFSKMKGVVRGKYAGRVKTRPRMIRLADDLSDSFPDDEAVNQALRDYLANGMTKTG